MDVKDIIELAKIVGPAGAIAIVVMFMIYKGWLRPSWAFKDVATERLREREESSSLLARVDAERSRDQEIAKERIERLTREKDFWRDYGLRGVAVSEKLSNATESLAARVAIAEGSPR